MSAPTVDVEPTEADEDVWDRCGKEIIRWFKERMGEEVAPPKTYCGLIDELLRGAGLRPGVDYWFYLYVPERPTYCDLVDGLLWNSGLKPGVDYWFEMYT